MRTTAAQERASQDSAAGELRRLAWLLDDAIRLPGGFRVGLDGIVGLIPGIGDALGLVASGYIIFRARRFGVPGAVLARMSGNVVLEFLIGTVPVLGDLFDFAFKANRRNLALMEQYLVKQRETTRSSRLRIVIAAAVGLVLLALLLFLVVRLAGWLWNLVSA